MCVFVKFCFEHFVLTAPSHLCPQLCSWSVCGHGPGDARCALAFLHRKRDEGVTLTCSTTFCLSAGHENRLCTSLSQASSAFSSHFSPPPLYQTRTAVSAFTLVRTQKPQTMFCGSFSLKRCLRGEDRKDTARIFFSSSSSFFVFFFSFLLHVERMCHAWDSEPNGRDLNGSSWSPRCFFVMNTRKLRMNSPWLKQCLQFQEGDAESYRIRRNHFWLVAF